MIRFLVFWNSGFDLQNTAQAMADHAAVHAKQTGKQLSTRLVDVTAASPDKAFWDQPDTIECVTVKDGVKKDSALNPAFDEIDAMVDSL
jgi:hypothetical protein